MKVFKNNKELALGEDYTIEDGTIHLITKLNEYVFIGPHGYLLSITTPDKSITIEDIKNVSDLLVETLNSNNFILKDGAKDVKSPVGLGMWEQLKPEYFTIPYKSPLNDEN